MSSTSKQTSNNKKVLKGCLAKAIRDREDVSVIRFLLRQGAPVQSNPPNDDDWAYLSLNKEGILSLALHQSDSEDGLKILECIITESKNKLDQFTVYKALRNNLGPTANADKGIELILKSLPKEKDWSMLLSRILLEYLDSNYDYENSLPTKAQVEMFMRCGADPKFEDTSDWNLLHAFCRRGAELDTIVLLHEVPVNDMNDDFKTPLAYACAYCSFETVKWLVEKAGANPRPPLPAVPPLFAVMDCKKSINWKGLVELGFDLHQEDEDGDTLIHIIVSNGFPGMLEDILECDPSLANIRNSEGGTLLHTLITAHGHRINKETIDRCYTALTSKGNLTLLDTDNFGRTPLMAAVVKASKMYGIRSGVTEHVKVCAHQMKKEGMTLDSVDTRGWTALQLANFLGSNEMVEILLEAGANPRVFNGVTAGLPLQDGVILTKTLENLVARWEKEDQNTSDANGEDDLAVFVKNNKKAIERAQQKYPDIMSELHYCDLLSSKNVKNYGNRIVGVIEGFMENYCIAVTEIARPTKRAKTS
jgi:ankyrin repeat protein